jgi:hypothetical protein
MTPFDCGCTPDGTDRCRLHIYWGCHTARTSDGECPPCRIAKWRSVSLSAEATPTRRVR